VLRHRPCGHADDEDHDRDRHEWSVTAGADGFFEELDFSSGDAAPVAPVRGGILIRSYDTIVRMNTEDTKSALLEAAKELVLERGYAGASVRELAATAGANLGAVNYHFGTREKLLDEAILDCFLEWGARVGEVEVGPDAGPLEQLADRARPMVDGITESEPRFVIFLEALLQARRSPDLRRELAEHYARRREHAAEVIRESPGGEALPARMVEVVASYMLAVADGLQLQSLLDPEAVPTGEELAALYEGLAAAARAAGPSPSAKSGNGP
jgi:AcrR family transcriptional regulator